MEHRWSFDLTCRDCGGALEPLNIGRVLFQSENTAIAVSSWEPQVVIGRTVSP